MTGNDQVDISSVREKSPSGLGWEKGKGVEVGDAKQISLLELAR
jgi:hypothetical protein